MDLKPGDMFDPNTQEAISYEENDTYAEGQIIEVVQTVIKSKIALSDRPWSESQNRSNHGKNYWY